MIRIDNMPTRDRLTLTDRQTDRQTDKHKHTCLPVYQPACIIHPHLPPTSYPISIQVRIGRLKQSTMQQQQQHNAGIMPTSPPNQPLRKQ
ncbi:hypothetical protein BDW42DRAFT_160956 [Aspergillus taichungensis]|uniref:Uncharacterized protein n=1 Tax=Aspergillus taichungensis TaxID=482145 RepID=A0A2J5I5W3_9EURO|nr:hypothetical protein BDW42DRAFT_160956 [Aspergillus taichungensis]